jgi:hypothetical protein
MWIARSIGRGRLSCQVLARVARWFIFKTKNGNLGKFCRVFQRMLVYVMAIWSILRSFGIFWWILGSFGILSCFGMHCQEKSGSPGLSLKILKPAFVDLRR